MKRHLRLNYLPLILLTLFSVPLQATDLTAKAGNGVVHLNWTRNTEPDIEGYRIYYGLAAGLYNGTGATQGPSPITVSLGMLLNPAQPAYSISGLASGSEWHFKVYAMTGGVETDPSFDAVINAYGWGRLDGNLLQNPSFEDGNLVWFPTGFWQPMPPLRIVTASLDANIRLSGNKALKISSQIPAGNGVYRLSASQTPPGKTPDTDYLVRFWAKAIDAQYGCFGLILNLDDNWNQRLYARGGTYEWTQFARVYNTGPKNKFEVSLLCEGTGTMWIDDIEVIQISGAGLNPPFPETFQRYNLNPILDTGSAGSLDQSGVYNPAVLHDVSEGVKNSTTDEYKMYYSMHDGTNVRIGLATSPDGYTWAKYSGNPVLNLPGTGTWDDTHVNPSSILKAGSIYHLYYSGYKSPTWQIGHATSNDGFTWTRDPSNPVISTGNEGVFVSSQIQYGNVVYENGEFRMWYSAHDPGSGKNFILYATSPNGSVFTRHGVVLSPGGLGDMDLTGCTGPVVLKLPDKTYTMWYTGSSTLGNTGCYATSPDGLNWTPVGGAISPTYLGGSSFDSVQTNPASVLLTDDLLRMWYHGYNGTTYRIGLAEAAYIPSGSPTLTPTEVTPFPTNTPTLTLIPTNSPTETPTVETPTPTATPTKLPPTSTPTPLSISGREIFESGDALINFNYYPDGTAVNGANPNPYMAATYLIDQFASVGVRFHSIRDTYSGTVLTGIGVGVIYAPNNMILGMVNTIALNGNSTIEVQFDEPVKRAGLMRRYYLDYAGGNTAVTKFFDQSGSLINSIVTFVDGAFVSLEVPEGQPGIKRIEVTSSKPLYDTRGEGGVDDLMFSQVGSMTIPEVLQYSPPVTPTPTPVFDVAPSPSPDGWIDSRDLLIWTGAIQSGTAEQSILFDFSRWWHMNVQ